METENSPNSPDLFFIIDTNAVIQALNEPHKKEMIQEFLKGKKCKIVLCNEVFLELFEPKKLLVGRWPGFTKDIIIKHLTETFGDRILDYSTTGEEKSLAASLEKKYNSKELHYPDSILLAIAKIEGWNNIITGDVALSICCSLENVSCFDQNLLIPKIIEIKKYDPKEILSKLDTNYSIKELEDDVIWLFKDLYDKWNSCSSNGWDDVNSKFVFQTALQRRISTLKSHEPLFGQLLKYKIDSLYVEKFFLKIKNGINSYDDIFSLLKSKQELKKQNTQNLQDLLDS